MKRLIILLSLSLSTIASASEATEQWECKKAYRGSWDEILVTASFFNEVKNGAHVGEINVGGIAQKAAFNIRGLERNWYFGPEGDKEWRHILSIEPNGDAKYYDFGNSSITKPSKFMTCRKF